MGTWKKASRRWSGWSMPTRLGLGIGAISVFVSFSAWIWPNLWSTRNEQDVRLASKSSTQTRPEPKTGNSFSVKVTEPQRSAAKSPKPANSSKIQPGNALPLPGEHSNAKPRTALPVPMTSEATEIASSSTAASASALDVRPAIGVEINAGTGEQKPSALLRHTTGTVKWFNTAKGYGFITDSSGRDVYVHFSEIAEPGYKFLEDGAVVEFDVIMGPKGSQAHKVKIVRAKD